MWSNFFLKSDESMCNTFNTTCQKGNVSGNFILLLFMLEKDLHDKEEQAWLIFLGLAVISSPIDFTVYRAQGGPLGTRNTYLQDGWQGVPLLSVNLNRAEVERTDKLGPQISY